MTIEQRPSLLASLRRYKWRIAIAALLSAAVIFTLSLLQTTVYRAEGAVLLNDPRTAGGIATEIGLVLDPRPYVSNQAKIMESPQVAQRAADNLNNGTTATNVEDAVTATPEPNLIAVHISADQTTPTDASALLDAVVAAYEEIITEQVRNAADANIATLEASKAETEARLGELDTLIAANPDDSVLAAQQTAASNQVVALETRIEVLSTNAALYGSGVQLYVAERPPTSPVQPRPLRNAVAAFVLAAVAVGVWAWWHAEQNQVADHRNSPAATLGAPLLATIPEYKSAQTEGPIPTITAPTSGVAEAYQFALSSVGFALENITGHTILVTSTSPGDGKTSVALNLAIAAAHDRRNLLLIDADERVQGLTKLAGIQDQPGISDLDGARSIERAIHTWSVDGATSINFVPAGRGVNGNTASFFRSEGFRSAIKILLKDRDIVIIDSPPVMAAAETTDIAAVVDAIVLVITEGTPLGSIDEARKRLAMSGTPIIGYIYNRAAPRQTFSGYGYGVAT